MDARIDTDLFCLSCGYNQRGIVAERCPECGQVYAEVPPSPLRLPWVHRRHLGLLTAYWRTVRLVLFDPRRLSDEVQHPLSLRDGRRFWFLTIIHAYLPLLAAMVALYLSLSPQQRVESGLFMPIYSPVFPAVSLNIGLLLFIAAATGWPSYYCHAKHLPIEQQNRAIALSYYACAPLAMLPIAMALIMLGLPMFGRVPLVPVFLVGIGALSLLLTLGFWYLRTRQIVCAIANRRPRWISLRLIFDWAALAVLMLFFTPLLIHYSVLLIWAVL